MIAGRMRLMHEAPKAAVCASCKHCGLQSCALQETASLTRATSFRMLHSDHMNLVLTQVLTSSLPFQFGSLR